MILDILFCTGSSSPAEYGIAMGAAVVAVLLVMFGVALCICVILQYLRQQRDGPESPYSRTLSRDVYSVEGVDIAGLQSEFTIIHCLQFK